MPIDDIMEVVVRTPQRRKAPTRYHTRLIRTKANNFFFLSPIKGRSLPENWASLDNKRRSNRYWDREARDVVFETLASQGWRLLIPYRRVVIDRWCMEVDELC